MKKCLLLCLFLLSLSGIKSQKPTVKAEINGLDIFVLGDGIDKYENKLIAQPLKMPKSTGARYQYKGKEITAHLGFTVKEISLEFCSDKLENITYRFGGAGLSSKESFSGAQLDQLKNKLVQLYGNPRMHNNNSMGADEKGRGELNSENWTWVSKTTMMSLTWTKITNPSINYVSLSVLDRNLRKDCYGK